MKQLQITTVTNQAQYGFRACEIFTVGIVASSSSAEDTVILFSNYLTWTIPGKDATISTRNDSPEDERCQNQSSYGLFNDSSKG